MPREKQSLPRPQVLHTALAAWYATDGRTLPWRGSPDPYHILVSEVMLQQTQVVRVIPVFRAFIDRFPSFEALADASPADVITAWRGMGYNSRAIRLQQLARVVVDQHGGALPRSTEELRQLPGVGPYTAAAVACFAFGAAVPVLDTNIYRVLSRVHHGTEAPDRQAIDPVAADLVPGSEGPLTPSDWSQALMDVGATICTARAPRCMLCPFQPHCAAAPSLQGGDRALAERSVPYVPKQGTFAGSTRFFRGRIIDVLREAGSRGVRVSALAQELPDADVPGLVKVLVRDGLAVEDRGVVRLPS